MCVCLVGLVSLYIYIFKSESKLAAVNFTITSDRCCSGVAGSGGVRKAPTFSPFTVDDDDDN